MSDICLYMATEKFDPVSVLIREKTLCDWSHVGFYRLSDNMTFSAMCDGLGVMWRPVKPTQEILLLDAVGIDAAFAKALTQIGKPYDKLDIAGIALGFDWSAPEHFICSALVFWAFEPGATAGALINNSFERAGQPLINMQFIPRDHMTPRDVLLSPFVTEHRQ
jgi:hypothetical protein